MGLVRVERGQLVLVAAAVVAVALAAVLFAYVQLGYHPDVEDDPDVTGEAAIEFLDRSVHAAAASTAGDHEWGDQGAMAAAVREHVDADVETLETSRLQDGVVYDVRYNDTAASAWADDHCSVGDGRRFGGCVTDGGVAMQERAGEAVLLAVAFDLRVTAPDGEAALTVVVDLEGGR